MDIAADKLSDIGRYAKSLAEKLGRNCEVSTTTHPGGPGITRSDLLVINKTDLAPYVGASLEAMERDAKPCAGARSFVFSNLRAGHGVEEIARFIEHKGGLRDSK